MRKLFVFALKRSLCNLHDCTFKQIKINFYSSLKSTENVRLSDDFRGNKKLINLFDSFNTNVETKFGDDHYILC